ncbi:hypothetical protein [Roseibium marinum]|uniref:Uncharacterized protein n=1 Tax=Roseibium marinum TaxID=281252 RepID=A0A2S3UXH2_9HYPH|nr:hypothetical protein [Roseibium marinum]POF32425.1 hypothetical protein CLV41_103348 [Roseibium marinum]
MHIKRIDPANMKGLSGQYIQELEAFLKHTSGVLRPGMPLFDRVVFTSTRADGDHIPKIGYVGKGSYIQDVMSGQFGADFASAIRNQDPRFDAAVAGGFARAAQGHRVCELVEMEVTPPGALKGIPVSYYRFIDRLWLGAPSPVLVNLTLPTLTQFHELQFLQDRAHLWPN